jgi:hypothetical protein
VINENVALAKHSAPSLQQAKELISTRLAEAAETISK